MRTDESTFPIPHVDLTTAEKETHQKVMANGNVMLKQWHQKVKIALHSPMPYSRVKFRSELFAILKECVRPITMHGVDIPKEDIGAIIAVRKCEMPILMAHAKLIAQTAHKAFRMNDDCNLEIDDYFSEGLIAAINAVYCYTDCDVLFGTFMVHSVRRRLMNFALENKPLSRWTYDAYTLLGRLEYARRQVNGPVSFDELVRIEHFTAKEIRTLTSMLTKVIHESEITHNNEREDDADFSRLARDVTKKKEKTIEFDETDSVQQAITDADLTQWEQMVLNAFLITPDNKNGWKTEVAENNVNPQTGKAYSRAAPAVAMERIKEKVREALERQAEAA